MIWILLWNLVHAKLPLLCWMGTCQYWVSNECVLICQREMCWQFYVCIILQQPTDRHINILLKLLSEKYGGNFVTFQLLATICSIAVMSAVDKIKMIDLLNSYSLPCYCLRTDEIQDKALLKMVRRHLNLLTPLDMFVD